LVDQAERHLRIGHRLAVARHANGGLDLLAGVNVSAVVPERYERAFVLDPLALPEQNIVVGVFVRLGLVGARWRLCGFVGGRGFLLLIVRLWRTASGRKECQYRE
jgi:hypothetical protein